MRVEMGEVRQRSASEMRDERLQSSRRPLDDWVALIGRGSFLGTQQAGT